MIAVGPRDRRAVSSPERGGAAMLVCFDYEGRWGMPFNARYDLEAATHAILDRLARHRAQAVFFTVGALALEHPELIRTIADQGHEIALHGWHHERINRLTAAEAIRFRDGILEAGTAIEQLTGFAPKGFRAPFLLGPHFFDPTTYGFLQESGYGWASNREIRHPVELLRPDRIRTGRPWRLAQRWTPDASGVGAQALLIGLNAGLCLRDPVGGSAVSAARWLASGFPPFFRDALLEVPVYSPLDCDLIGLPDPTDDTPAALLEYASFALIRVLSAPRPVRMLTFHDWIIAGGNRLTLLERLLEYLNQAGLRATASRDCWSTLSSLASRSADASDASDGDGIR